MNLCKKILQTIATFSLAVFILFGILIVLIQAFGIITLNGTLTASIGAIENVSITSAGILGVSSFLLSYLEKSRPKTGA